MAFVWAGNSSLRCLYRSLHIPPVSMFHARQKLLYNTSPPQILQRPLIAFNSIRHYSKPRESQSTFSSTLRFWSLRSAWRRAGVNTLRCLFGCTLGDFSTMWYLQAFYPDLRVGLVMALSSKNQPILTG